MANGKACGGRSPCDPFRCIHLDRSLVFYLVVTLATAALLRPELVMSLAV